VWSGDPAEGEAATAPLRRVGKPLADAVRPTPYLALQTMLDAGNPHGLHYYWRSRRLTALGGDVGTALIDAVGAITSPMSYLAGLAIGGAATRVSADATAVGERTPGFELNAVAAWPGSDPDASRHVRWVRDLSDRLEPHSRGVFSHFLSDEGDAGITAAFGDRMTRLRRLKDRYDPDNAFRLNANIPPTTEPQRKGA
jgi:FAD/FMN-containing dehydrogenase